MTVSQPPSIAVARFRDISSSSPPSTVDRPWQHLQPASRCRPVLAGAEGELEVGADERNRRAPESKQDQ